MALGLAPSPSLAQSFFPKQYDRQIKQAADYWLPGVPWRLWKAQLYQESRLDPAARSPAGAEGLAQFMPATWADIAPTLGYGLLDRRLAEPAINGGAYYMGILAKRWRVLPNWKETHRHAQGGYNAGNGNIARAWIVCAEPEDWHLTVICLPVVTGKYAWETNTYIENIWEKWWPRMELDK